MSTKKIDKSLKACAQKMLDTVALHLIMQGERSMSNRMDCQYYGPYGLKCAIGALIPKRLYKHSMEGLNAQTLIKEYPAVSDYLGGDTFLPLLSDLQDLHDRTKPETWADGLQDVARRHDLRAPKCKP